MPVQHNKFLTDSMHKTSSIVALAHIGMLQVDFMTSQMSEMQHEVDDKLKIESALKKAEEARKQVDASQSASSHCRRC